MAIPKKSFKTHSYFAGYVPQSMLDSEDIKTYK